MNRRERERFDDALGAGNGQGDCLVCDGGKGGPCSESCDLLKACACGLAYSTEAWSRLAFVGINYFPADTFGPAEAIELRNCVCGSTIAINADVGGAIAYDVALAHFLGGEVLS